MRRTLLRRAATLAAGLALVASVAAACSDPTAGGTDPGGQQSGGPSAAAGPKTVNVYLYQKPTTFYPAAPAAGANQLVMSTIFEPLLGTNDKYELFGKLAEKWEISSDGKTITFHLRKGVVWSDGTPFTSKDVKFTYEKFADTKAGSGYALNFASVEGIDAFQSGKAKEVAGFQTPDESTFVVKSTKANVGLVAQIGVYLIFPEHVLKDVAVEGFDKHAFWSNPTVGTGPFTFVAYKTDQYVEVKANPKYRTKVAVDRMFLKPVTSDAATASLQNGEMDLVQISPTDLQRVEQMKGVTVSSGPGPGFIRIAFDLQQPRFKDKRVRQAMAYAVDRKSMVDTILGGKGTVQNSVFMGDAVPSDINQYPYDPDKAKALLKEAGWDSSQTVTINWIPGQRDRDAAATIVESQLNEVGIKAKLNQIQTPVLPPKDGLLFGGGNYVVEPYNDRVVISCKTWTPNGGNLPRYCNPQVDALMEQANATLDRDERMKIYQQAAKIENDEVPYLWLFDPDAIWATSSRLKGVKATGDFTGIFWNAAEWTVDDAAAK
jgi:peptide/nickel transport system substrate-binding protein